MKIDASTSRHDTPRLEFNDLYDDRCIIQGLPARAEEMWFGTESNPMLINREMAGQIAKTLANFCKTGEIKPPAAL